MGIAASPLLITCDVIGFVIGVRLAGDITLNTWPLVGLAVGLFAAGALYRPRLSLSVLDDAPQIIGRLTIAAALAGGYRRFVAGEVVLTEDRLRVLVAVSALVLTARLAGYGVLRLVRRRRVTTFRTLVVGAGHVGAQVASALLDHREYGLEPVGFYDADPLPSVDRPLPLLSGSSSLAESVAAVGAEVVVVAFGALPESAMVDVIRTCNRLRVEIFFVPRLFELSSVAGRDVDHVWSLPVVRLPRAPYRAPTWPLKRLLDMGVAGLALIVVSPLLAVCALAVRLEGGPGVIYRQERIGVDGRPFTIFKLRSLKPDPGEAAVRWNIGGDARVGPVGRILRKTSIDELPQLWNVLRGDMSLVGPRPERPHFVNTFSAAYPHYSWRHRVPSGLTGWAQVHGLRGDTSIEERARFDNFYIENWSLWLDLKIMLQTISAVVSKRGA